MTHETCWRTELMLRVDAPSWRTELTHRVDAPSWRRELTHRTCWRNQSPNDACWRTELTHRVDGFEDNVSGLWWRIKCGTSKGTHMNTSIHTMWSTCFANRVLLSSFDIFFCSTSTGSNDCKSHVWWEYGHWYMQWIYIYIYIHIHRLWSIVHEAQNGLIDLPSPLGLRMTTIRQL